MRLLEQVQREQFIILKTRYDPGVENQPHSVPQLASQSHMFYVSGRKSINKSISLSFWFVIDYCFLVTQWLMITLFFGPEGHVSYSSLHIHSFMAESIIKLVWIQFQHLHLGVLLVPRSSPFTELLCLVSHSPIASHFLKLCLLSWTQHSAIK